MVFQTYLGVGSILTVPANPKVQEQSMSNLLSQDLAFKWESETKGFINELLKQMDTLKGEGEKSFIGINCENSHF